MPPIGTREDLFRKAFELARDAIGAGLVTVQITPTNWCHGDAAFTIALYMPDGKLWAESRHEHEDEVRGHIRRYIKAPL